MHNIAKMSLSVFCTEGWKILGKYTKFEFTKTIKENTY